MKEGNLRGRNSVPVVVEASTLPKHETNMALAVGAAAAVAMAEVEGLVLPGNKA